MNFLAPLFLLGAAAIAGPILFHLIRRTTRERTVFSSLMFLAPSPPRLSKRHRLEHLLLLALRCAALGLLAFAFARPFLRRPPPIDPAAAQPKHIVVLVDTSASMRRAGLWAAARERVDAVLRRIDPADHVALLTFDRAATTRVSFEEWNRAPASERTALLAARLGAVTPGWAGTHLGSALITAAETLAEPEANAARGAAARMGPREIVLVSDLQSGSRLDTLQAYEWPKGVQLILEPVKARNVTNAGLQLLADDAASGDAARANGAAVRVRVTNAADSKREQFQVGWARSSAPGTTADSAPNYLGAPLDAYVPPGQSRVITLPLPKDPTGADRIVLRGDDEPFDNTVFAVPPSPERATALWFGTEATDDAKQPLFFLRRALTDTPRVTINLIARPPGAPLDPAALAAASVVFVADPLATSESAALHAAAVAGKTIVVVAKSPAIATTLGALAGTEPWTVREVQPANYAMFGEIDFGHPLFAPFADPRFSDFTKIHIWKYRRIDPVPVADAHLAAKWDSGDPAIIDAPIGRGRLVVFTAGWQPDDSQLAVSSKFVPLLWSLLELGGQLSAGSLQYAVGDAVAVAAGAVIRTTAGVALTPDTTTRAVTLNTPGIYELVGTAGAKPRRFSVNLDANESRTAPLDLDELEHLGVPAVAADEARVAMRADTQSLLASTEAENRQKLWRWFIAATLAVLLVETALAGWTARRLTTEAKEATP